MAINKRIVLGGQYDQKEEGFNSFYGFNYYRWSII